MTADEIRAIRAETGQFWFQEIAAQFAEFNETFADVANYLFELKQTLAAIKLSMEDK